MAPHSSTLAWRVPWMEEPGRLQSWGHEESLNDFTFTFHFHALEKEMAAHSSVLAWRIPGTGKPHGLPSLGSHRAGQDKRLSSSSSSDIRTYSVYDVFGTVLSALYIFFQKYGYFFCSIHITLVNSGLLIKDCSLSPRAAIYFLLSVWQVTSFL